MSTASAIWLVLIAGSPVSLNNPRQVSTIRRRVSRATARGHVHADANSYAYPHTDPYGDSHEYANQYSNGHTDAHEYANCLSYGETYGYADAHEYAYGHRYSDPDADADAYRDAV